MGPQSEGFYAVPYKGAPKRKVAGFTEDGRFHINETFLPKDVALALAEWITTTLGEKNDPLHHR